MTLNDTSSSARDFLSPLSDQVYVRDDEQPLEIQNSTRGAAAISFQVAGVVISLGFLRGSPKSISSSGAK